ncbi:MAG: DUF4386 domain-containing protein [Chloroflexota bacterium]|nr:DUF4386 domain-containing protein [Chloroflexota bacterium]
MTERESYLWTAIAGIATVAATMVAIAIFLSVGPPDESDSGPQVAAFFADNRMPVLIALYCAAIGTGVNLAFYLLLRDVFRRLDAGVETLAALGVAGGITFIAIVFTAFGVLAQMAFREGAGDPQTYRTLMDVYALMLVMSGLPTAVSLIAISLAVLRTQLFPSWLAWYGFAVAAVHLVSAGSFARDGFFTPTIVAGTIAPVLFELWVLAICVVLLMRPRDERATKKT